MQSPFRRHIYPRCSTQQLRDLLLPTPPSPNSNTRVANHWRGIAVLASLGIKVLYLVFEHCECDNDGLRCKNKEYTPNASTY